MSERVDADEFRDVVASTLQEGKPLRLKVTGSSMRPLFKDGRTRVELAPPGRLKRYDIVLFEREGRFFLHRIVRMGAGRALTRGDFNVRPDGTVPLDDILGKVVRDGVDTLKPTERRSQRAFARLWHGMGPLRRLLVRVLRRLRRPDDAHTRP